MIAVLLAASLAVGNITRDTGPACEHLTAHPGIITRTLTNGAMTSGSPFLDSAGAGFVAADVIGRAVCVRGAGGAGALLCAMVIARPSSTRLTLNQNAGTSVTGATAQLSAYLEVTAAAISSGAATLTGNLSGTMDGKPEGEPITFLTGDQLGEFKGRRIAIAGAGPAGALLVATITDVISANQITISTNASTTVSNQTARIPRAHEVKVTLDEMSAPVTRDDLVAALKVWGKLAQADGKTLAQMEGQTVVAAVP